jgi:uncharacterized membrane protein
MTTYLILYNTLLAVAAGIGLIGVATLYRKLSEGTTVFAEGWSLLFGMTGFILTILGLAVTITWPYHVPGVFDANILFGEPSVAFGVVLLAEAFYFWHARAALNLEKLQRMLKPISLYVFGLGLVMAACAISWVRYRLGAAPPAEPISGRFGGHPVIESSFLGALYGLIALGALLFPFALHKKNAKLGEVIYICWMVAGIVLLLFGALNYYTHIGDLQNTYTGTHYKY